MHQALGPSPGRRSPAAARPAPPARPTGPVAARRAAALLAAVLLAGCAATTPATDDSDLRLAAATHAFGGGFDYLIVHSAGPLADQALAALGAAGAPSPLARRLAERLAPATDAPLRMLVTGPNRETTRRVVLGALRVLDGRELPGLELLFLGDPRDAPAIQAAVEARGGRFLFAPYAS